METTDKNQYSSAEKPLRDAAEKPLCDVAEKSSAEAGRAADKAAGTAPGEAAGTAADASASSATGGDFLDDLIDISEGLSEVLHPLEGIANALADSVTSVGTNVLGTGALGDVLGSGAGSVAVRANATAALGGSLVSFQPQVIPSKCSRCATKNEQACALCLEACPTHCLTIEGAEITVDEDRCLGCGLCFATCPTEAFTSKKAGIAILDEVHLYKNIIKRATSHERAYVTCLHAAEQQGLLHATNPHLNLLIVPCLAAITKEVWFAVLADFPNIDILLPPALCQTCPVNANNQAAEKTYETAIATAESWTGTSVGLLGNKEEMDRAQKRELKRAHFLSSVTDAPEAFLSGKAPKGFEARRDEIVEKYLQRLDAFSKRAQQKMNLGVPNALLPPDFNKTEAAMKKRARAAQLTKNQLLLLATLFYHPHLGPNVMLQKLERDAALCTFCGACEKACITGTVQFTKENKWRLQKEACAWCEGCSACKNVCPAGALRFEAVPAKGFLF